MRKYLMATVALAFVGSALAQSANQGNAELFYMIEQLQREVRALRGEVEEQSNQINRLSRQSKSRYIDLDQRILSLSEKTGEASPASEKTGNSPSPTDNKQEQREYRAPSADEEKAYQAIQSLIHEDKDYDAAISGLYDFIGKYPEGDLLVNAYYWLGEVYLIKPQLEQAKQAFTIVANRYGDHRKAPDAVYKLGVTLDRQGEKQQAKSRMNEVIRSYPGSGAAKLAQNFLESQ